MLFFGSAEFGIKLFELKIEANIKESVGKMNSIQVRVEVSERLPSKTFEKISVNSHTKFTARSPFVYFLNPSQGGSGKL
jgi:hypothetical protein